MSAIKKVGDYWVDGKNNKWEVAKFPKEVAQANSYTLINCFECVNCYNCKECVNCYNCEECVDCIGCINCENCSSCHACVFCRNCICCFGCYDCVDCYECIGISSYKGVLKHVHKDYKLSNNSNDYVICE